MDSYVKGFWAQRAYSRRLLGYFDAKGAGTSEGQHPKAYKRNTGLKQRSESKLCGTSTVTAMAVLCLPNCFKAPPHAELHDLIGTWTSKQKIGGYTVQGWVWLQSLLGVCIFLKNHRVLGFQFKGLTDSCYDRL